MSGRLSPSRLALGYIAVSLLALALFAIPLWYSWQANLGTFRAYVPGEDQQRIVDTFQREGPAAAAAAVKAQAARGASDEIVLLADPAKEVLAGNLAAWPAEVPQEHGIYGLVIRTRDVSMRVVASHVALPGGYHLLMGRESVRFATLVARFWYGVATAMIALLALGASLAWLLRVRQTEQLRESEARWRGLTELWSDWYWRQDEHLRFTYSSAATDPPDGYPGGSSIGKTRWELAGIVPLSSSWAEHQALLAARKPFRDFEYSRPAPDGTLRYISTSGTPVFDEKGAFRGYQGVARNITERKRADEALRQSEDRYMRAMAAAEAGFWDWDVVRDEYYVSPRLLEMAGLPKDTVIGGRVDFQARVPLHPEDLAHWQRAIKALFESGGSRLSTELRVILGAQTRWYRLDGMCFRDAAGRVVRWTGSSIDITERKHIEEALRLSEERYARVMQASEDGVWEWVAATDEFYASPRMLAMYGLPPDTVFSGRADFLARFPFHPEDLAQWRKAVAAHLAGECARVDLEARVKLQGRTRWMHVSAVCQRDAGGAAQRWTGAVSDVTERRHAQAALQGSEERYARAMEGSDAGHWDWNIVTDEMFVSERAREMMALPREQVPASRSEIMALAPMHPDDRRAMDVAVTAGIQSGTYERDYRIIPRPGETRWLRSRAKVYKDARGAAVRMTGSLIDITERKLAGDALRASEERYSLAIEASEEGFVDANIDTEEFFTSARLNEIFGLAPDLRFKDRSDFLRQIRFHGNDGETYAREIGAVMAKGGPERYAFEFRIVLPSGEVRWLRTRGKVTRDAEGRARRRIGVVADITARKLAEEDRRESQERYARAMEATEAGHWEWDLVTHQVFHSPRFRELYGVGPDEIFADRDAWKARQPISAAERERQERALQAAIADPSKRYDIELSFEVRPGEVRWLRSRAKVFRAPDGRALRVTGATTDITAQKLAQEALRRSEERYALAMEAAGDGHTDWNFVTGEFYISPRMLKIVGHARDATFADRADWVRRFPFHPEERPRWEAALAEHFAGTEAKFRMDLRIVVNGETRWVAFTFIASRDPAGKVVRWTGSIADINDAKLAEAALRQSEDRHSRAMSAADSGFWDWHLANDEFYVSPRLLEMTGFAPGTTFAGRADFMRRAPFHPDDREAYQRAVKALFAGDGSRIAMELRVIVEGETTWQRLAGMCFRDAEGKVVRWTGSATYVTERKRAEDALRLSEERYALALEASEEGHFDNDLETGEIFVSARVNEIYGFPRRARSLNRLEFLNQLPIHPDDRHVVAELMRQDWQDPAGGLHEIECRIVPRPGETRWIHSRAKVVRDAGGRPVRRVGVVTDITARKLAEEALRASEERYALAVAGASDGIWDEDLVTGMLYRSPRNQEIALGRPSDGIDVRPRSEWAQWHQVHPDDAPKRAAAIRAHLEGRTPLYEIEYRVRHPDGTDHWILARGLCTRDASGRALRIAGSTTNIDARKAAEEGLRESEERYALAVAGSDDGVWDIDFATRSVFLSARARELCGLPAGPEIVPYDEFLALLPVHPDDTARRQAAMQAHLAGDAPAYVGEFRLRQLDGVYRWRRIRGICVRDANGRPLRMAGSFGDVDARKRAEEALRLSEQRYAVALEVADEGHWDWNVQTDEIFASTQALRVMGVPQDRDYRTRADVMGHTRYHPDDGPRIEEEWRAALAGPDLEREFEYRLLRHGQWRSIRARWKIFRDADGAALRVIGIIADITERKRAEEALREQTERLQLGQAAMRMIIMDWNVTEDVLTWSDSPEWLRGPMPAGGGYPPFKDQVHREDRDRFLATRRLALETLQVQTTEFRLVRTDGEVLWVLERKQAFAGADRKAVRMLAAMFDITDRKLAEALLSGEKRILETVAQGEPLQEVLDDLCRLVEELAPGVLASILLLEGDRLRHGGAPSLPKAYTDLIDGAAIGPSAGSCGTAAYRGEQVIVSDIATDALWADYRALALPHGLRACWSTPVLSPEGKVIATFAMYYREPRSPAARDQQIIEQIGHLAGVAIQHKLAAKRLAQSEKELRLSEERYALAMEASAEGHFDWNVQSDEIFASASMKKLLGLPAEGEYRTRSEMSARVRYYPGDLERLNQRNREVLGSGALQNEFEYRILRGGDVRWLRVYWKILRDADGAAQRVTGVLTDITERKLAADALAESEARFRALTGLSSDWYWQQDEDLRFSYISHQGLNATGLPGQTVIGRTRWDFEHVKPLAGSWDEHQAALAARQPFRDLELVATPPGGPASYLSISGAPIFGEQGEFRGYHGVARDTTERKRVEEALRHSEERYALAVEGSNEGIFDWDLVSDRAYVSYRAQELFGLPRGELWRPRRDWRHILTFHPDDAPRLHDSIKAHIEGGAPTYDVEFRIVLPDGAVRWFRQRGIALRDAAGKAYRVVGSIGDITERKRAEEELRASEARFRGLVELSSDWYWKQDENLRFVSYVPPEVGTRSGIAAGASLGKQRWDFDSIKPLSSTWEEHKAVLAARQPFRDFEYVRVDEHGTPHYTVISGVPTFDSEGRFTGYEGVGTNISERRRFEEELRSRQEMLELAQKSARAVAFEWKIGEGGGENRWSTDLEAMYGFAPGAYDGSFEMWRKLVHAEDWPAVKDAIQHARRTGDVDAEYRVVHPGGAVHWLHAKGRMLFDAAGTPSRMVGFMQDVSDRRHAQEEYRRMERQLRQAQRLEAMGTLAGGIAHDFNNILGAILGYGEMALRDAAKGSRLRRDLDSIIVAGERGRALVDRVLAFSRSGVGERVPVHVEKVVREALDLISSKLPPNVTLYPKLNAGAAAMLGDATQVHQVLMNLATNAIHAMPKGGRLRVQLDAVHVDTPRVAAIGTLSAADYLVLGVADTGTGIAPEIMERIFDPFFTTKEVGTGTGLGLSLVHGIVTELGGAIDVASTHGAGSAFTVYLPRSGEAVDSVVEEESELPRGEGQRVLVVDDEEPLVRLATRTLEELGYAPVGFTSSTAALAAFRADPKRFDALITDERMPGLSGSALIREVRGIRGGIPIVLMSGFVGAAVARQAREAGAEEVLKKPLSARDLAASLARVLHP